MKALFAALISLALFSSGSFALSLISMETTIIYGMMRYGERTDGFQYQGVIGNLDSSSDPSAASLGVSVERPVDRGFIGARMILPLLKTTAKESWRFNGTEFQVNDLSYTLTGLDLYGGYPFGPLGRMMFGLNLTKAEQTRNNFVQGGVPIPIGTSTEMINSVNVFAGFRGDLAADRFTVEYGLRAIMPVSVLTTNTLLPDFSFSSGGYSLAADIGVKMPVTEISSVSCGLGYKFIHYDGSGWVTQGAQTAKWPANDTTSLDIKISYTTKF